jgi:hypothetical protein
VGVGTGAFLWTGLCGLGLGLWTTGFLTTRRLGATTLYSAPPVPRVEIAATGAAVPPVKSIAYAAAGPDMASATVTGSATVPLRAAFLANLILRTSTAQRTAKHLGASLRAVQAAGSTSCGAWRSFFSESSAAICALFGAAFCVGDRPILFPSISRDILRRSAGVYSVDQPGEGVR